MEVVPVAAAPRVGVVPVWARGLGGRVVVAEVPVVGALLAGVLVRGGTDDHAGTAPVLLGACWAAATGTMLRTMQVCEARRRSLRGTKERTRFLDGARSGEDPERPSRLERGFFH